MSRLVVIGLMVFTRGAFLIIGYRDGLVPTLPFFGFFIAVIGMVIVAAGRY